MRVRPITLLFAEFLYALGANELVVETGYIFCLAAENTSGVVLCENYLVSVDEHFNSVAAADVQIVADFDRNNYSSEVVDLSYHSCRFHVVFLSQWMRLCRREHSPYDILRSNVF